MDILEQWREFINEGRYNDRKTYPGEPLVEKSMEEQWAEFISEGRYNDKKTYPGDPNGNYDDTGTFNKLGAEEEQATFYTQDDEVVDLPDNLAAQYDADAMGLGSQHTKVELERALRDALEILGQGDPAEVYDKLENIRNLIDQIGT